MIYIYVEIDVIENIFRCSFVVTIIYTLCLLLLPTTYYSWYLFSLFQYQRQQKGKWNVV